MPSSPKDSTPEIETFITRWAKAEASERANYQMFLAELADLLDVPHPDPAGADNEFNQYVFDRAITRQKPDSSSTTVWADLYKRGCFILETKQGAYAKKEKADPIASHSSSTTVYRVGEAFTRPSSRPPAPTPTQSPPTSANVPKSASPKSTKSSPPLRTWGSCEGLSLVNLNFQVNNDASK